MSRRGGAVVTGAGRGLGREIATRQVASVAVEQAGSLDLRVNNAGVIVTGPAWEQDDAQRRLMFEVNALGTMHGLVAAL